MSEPRDVNAPRWSADDPLFQPRDETWEIVNAAMHPGYRLTIEPWWAHLWDDPPISPLMSAQEVDRG